MRWMGEPQRGHAWPKRPCTAISGRNAVTPSGNFFLASDERRSIQSFSVDRVSREETLPFFGFKFVRERNGRELRRMKNLVGVGIAHAADDARIGEGALEGAVLGSERGAKPIQMRGENFDAAGIDVADGLLAAQNVQRGAALGARLS